MADQQSTLTLVGSKVLILSVPFLDSVSVTAKYILTSLDFNYVKPCLDLIKLCLQLLTL